jgi:hypothetical protein
VDPRDLGQVVLAPQEPGIIPFCRSAVHALRVPRLDDPSLGFGFLARFFREVPGRRRVPVDFVGRIVVVIAGIDARGERTGHEAFERWAQRVALVQGTIEHLTRLSVGLSPSKSQGGERPGVNGYHGGSPPL